MPRSGQLIRRHRFPSVEGGYLKAEDGSDGSDCRLTRIHIYSYTMLYISTCCMICTCNIGYIVIYNIYMYPVSINMWHTTNITFFEWFPDTYSDIITGILTDIYSDIPSGILLGILSDRNWYIYINIIIYIYIYMFWHSIWHSIWREFWHSIWRSERLRSGSAHWDLALAVEVWQCPLRSGARGWGLAVPTEIWSLQLMVRRPALIKSRDPHPAGGGKTYVYI